MTTLFHGLLSRPSGVSVSNITVKWMNIFIKFPRSVHYDMRNNLEHFGDDAFNPLNTGFIFLFSGSVFATNIMEIQINGYS